MVLFDDGVYNFDAVQFIGGFPLQFVYVVYVQFKKSSLTPMS